MRDTPARTTPNNKSITLKDIARLAGVSLGTASNVINGRGNVSADLRGRVEEVINRMGYRPSAIARSIKQKRTMVIGLIIPKIKNVFYIQIIDAIEKLIQKRGYTLVLANSDEDLETEVAYLQTFAKMRVDGLIIASAGRKDFSRITPELTSFKSLEIPIVLIVRTLNDGIFDNVAIDNENGACRATEYALSQGHRRIAIISSPEHTSASGERISGYLRALGRFRIRENPNLIKISDLRPECGYQATKELCGLPSPPTAIFVASNFPLLGSLKALHELGRKIPDDMSLICFDDPDWGPYLNPPLTAVRPDSEKLCETAVSFLFDRITRNYAGPPRHSVVGTELIIRDSVSSRRGESRRAPA